jgi:hypothetical protein
MTHTLIKFRQALAWLQDTADLSNRGDAAAAEVFASLLADALEGYYNTAQEASDFAVAAGVAELDLLLEELNS